MIYAEGSRIRYAFLGEQQLSQIRVAEDDGINCLAFLGIYSDSGHTQEISTISLDGQEMKTVYVESNTDWAVY